MSSDITSQAMPVAAPTPDAVRSSRVLAIDAFRGFVMLSMLLRDFNLRKFEHTPILGTIYTQLCHVKWQGFHFEDYILPAFLFIIGMAIPLSDDKRRAMGESGGRRLYHAFTRTIFLFAIGMIINCILRNQVIYSVGVLQILAVSYIGGYLIARLSLRWQVFAFVFLVFMYWLIIFLFGHNSYMERNNLVWYIDMKLIDPSLVSVWGYYYTLITSTAMVVFGAIIGRMLINRKSAGRFMLWLLLLGVIGVLSGVALDPWVPIIKRMITSSYTLLTMGLCCLSMLVFYCLIDVLGFRRWAFVFMVIGANSIFIYVIDLTLHAWLIQKAGIFVEYYFARGIGAYTAPLSALVVLTFEFCLCLWLYRRKLYIRI